MARPKQTVASVHKHLRLPEDLVLRMEADLFSEVEGKIPQGAQGVFIAELLREHYRKVDGEGSEAK